MDEYFSVYGISVEGFSGKKSPGGVFEEKSTTTFYFRMLSSWEIPF